MSNTDLKIYILGARGYLGSLCTRYFKSTGYQVLNEKVDVTDLPALDRFFKINKPDVAINLTGPPANPTIDWCEDHKEETLKMIVGAPVNFSLAALKNGIYPIQITSGCIYSGGPEYEFTEKDEPNFFGSFYSRMRIQGQKALAELPVLQARIRMPISIVSHPRNFINKITSYRKVISVPNSVTLLEDLWPALDQLLIARPVGILNLTNEGYIEHSRLLEAYKKIINPNHEYKIISLKDLSNITKAGRSNCVLSVEKAKSENVYMPQIDRARLENIMLEYKNNLKKT